MEQRKSLTTRNCKEELKFERNRKQTEAFACDRCWTAYRNTSVGCYRISHHSVGNGDNIFAANKRIAPPFIIIGIMLILLGAWLWFSSNFKVKIDVCIKENYLVTSGVYSMVRNPIYSAFFLVCIGAFFIETNIILFVLPVVYYAYMTVFLIKTEEKWLSELYGQGYEEYCKNVNRCIPWIPKRK